MSAAVEDDSRDMTDNNNEVDETSEDKGSDPIADSWWFNQFQSNWLKPIEITCAILLVFLVMRWISLSGYPIFGSLWVPMFMYFGRGMNAFYERINTSTLKVDENGSFWTLFDPMHPVDPESNLNPNAPPIVGNIRIYAAKNRFVRLWVALLQIISSYVNGFVAYTMLMFRLVWSVFYLGKEQKWVSDHGIDGFYHITETPLNVWAENGSVRGPSPDGPQTDTQGNSLNFMTTILQRINWIATFGMDRTLYANLHLLPLFRITESRKGWIVILIVMYIFLSKAFVWTGVPETAEMASWGWYFVLAWIGVLGWSWWKGGFKLATSAFPAIRGFFMGDEETWGEPSRFGDFFRTLLRNQYDRNEGSLPTDGPLPEAFVPPVIIPEPVEPNMAMMMNNPEMQVNMPQMVGGAENSFENILGESIQQINSADKLLLPESAIVPPEVLAAEEVYQKKVIPTVVYESRIMTDKRLMEKEEAKLKEEHMEKVANSTPDPKSPEEQAKSMLSFAEGLASTVATTGAVATTPAVAPEVKDESASSKAPESPAVPIEEMKSQPNDRSFFKKMGNRMKEARGQISEMGSRIQESAVKQKQKIADFVRRGGEFPDTAEEFVEQQEQIGGGERRLRNVYERTSKITPITWIPVPTTWMSGIPN